MRLNFEFGAVTDRVHRGTICGDTLVHLYCDFKITSSVRLTRAQPHFTCVWLVDLHPSGGGGKVVYLIT
jgi:hypothetical protein